MKLCCFRLLSWVLFHMVSSLWHVHLWSLLWYECLCAFVFRFSMGWTSWLSSNEWNMADTWGWPYQGWVIKRLWLPSWVPSLELSLSCGFLMLGELGCPSGVQSYEETHMTKNWRTWSIAREHLSPARLVGGCSPRSRLHASFVRDPEPECTQLGHPQIPVPQKLWGSNDLFIKTAKFEGNLYIAIDN